MIFEILLQNSCFRNLHFHIVSTTKSILLFPFRNIVYNMETEKKDHFSSYMPATMKQPFAVISKLGLFSDNKLKRNSLAIVYALVPAAMNVVALMQFAGIKGDLSEFASGLEEMVGFSQVKLTTITFNSEKDPKRISNLLVYCLTCEQYCYLLKL